MMPARTTVSGAAGVLSWVEIIQGGRGIGNEVTGKYLGCGQITTEKQEEKTLQVADIMNCA